MKIRILLTVCCAVVLCSMFVIPTTRLQSGQSSRTYMSYNEDNTLNLHKPEGIERFYIRDIDEPIPQLAPSPVELGDKYVSPQGILELPPTPVGMNGIPDGVPAAPENTFKETTPVSITVPVPTIKPVEVKDESNVKVEFTIGKNTKVTVSLGSISSIILVWSSVLLPRIRGNKK